MFKTHWKKHVLNNFPLLFENTSNSTFLVSICFSFTFSHLMYNSAHFYIGAKHHPKYIYRWFLHHDSVFFRIELCDASWKRPSLAWFHRSFDQWCQASQVQEVRGRPVCHCTTNEGTCLCQGGARICANNTIRPEEAKAVHNGQFLRRISPTQTRIGSSSNKVKKVDKLKS